MPNHVSCGLTALPTILDAIAGAETETDDTTTATAIDFEKIIPMPQELRTVGDIQEHLVDWAKFATGAQTIRLLFQRHPSAAGSFRSHDYGAAADALHQAVAFRMLTEGPFPKDFDAADFEKLILAMRALRATGYAYWYDWAIANWGTKWNAYETERVSESVVTFQTAWSAPLPVIAALSARYPDNDICLRWADEDFGANVGDISFFAGQPISGGRLANGSPEAYAIALELIYGGAVPEGARLGPDGDLVWVEDEDSEEATGEE